MSRHAVTVAVMRTSRERSRLGPPAPGEIGQHQGLGPAIGFLALVALRIAEAARVGFRGRQQFGCEGQDFARLGEAAEGGEHLRPQRPPMDEPALTGVALGVDRRR